MIDLNELAARVQGQVQGVEIDATTPGRLDISGILIGHDEDEHWMVVDVFADGYVNVNPAIRTATHRRIVRAVLDEIDRQQSTPTGQPAEGAGGVGRYATSS